MKLERICVGTLDREERRFLTGQSSHPRIFGNKIHGVQRKSAIPSTFNRRQGGESVDDEAVKARDAA